MNLRRLLRNIIMLPLLPIFGTFGDTYETITTSHPFNKTYYNGLFLKGQENYVVFDQFAERQNGIDIPLNAGDTAVFTRVAPFGMSRTALTQGTNPNATKIKGNTVSATVAEYGALIEPSKKFWVTNLDKNLSETAIEFGKASASTIDSLIWEVVVENGIGLLADADSTNSGEVSCVASGSSTTTVVVSSLPGGISTSDTGVIVFLTGENAGMSRPFTYSTTNTITLGSAVQATVADGDLARVVCTQSLTTGDTINAELIRKAVALLESTGSPVFDDGYYHAVYTPTQKYDFQRDEEWLNIKQQAAPKDLYRNLDGELYNVRFHKDLNPYRHTAGTIGTYVSSAAVYVLSIFGKGAFGNVRVKGVNKKFYICPPEATTTNPLAMYGTMSWYDLCAPTVLDGRRIVNIFNCPTTL
jgi:N4-gp56 family major capsid protein